MLERIVCGLPGNGGVARLPHTKWAWRHTAKCVICELGLICGHTLVPAALDMGWERCCIGFRLSVVMLGRLIRNQNFRLESYKRRFPMFVQQADPVEAADSRAVLR